MTKTNGSLPHWDLEIVYPSLDAPALETDLQQILEAIDNLVALFDQHNIGRQEPAPVDDETVRIFEAVASAFNDTVEQMRGLSTFLALHISTDSRNDTAQARMSELQQQRARISILGTRLTAWIGSLDVEALIERSELAGEHAYVLRKAKKQAEHLMEPEQEALAAELDLTGSSAWNQMFNDFTSQLTVEVELEGEMQTLPLTAAQNLAYDPDRDVRRRAHEGVLATLEEAAVPLAAALNAVKGESLTLSRRRGWQSPLDEVLFESAIDRETLDAMLEATRDSFPDFRRYLQARARYLGLPALTWYDRVVPLGEGSQSWAYDEAAEFIIDQFATYSPRMSGMAERAFRDNWIDAEPRDGKRGGAFCAWLRQDESRILANYEPGFTSVGTLAHELGHAYHNLNLAGRTILQRSTPMTLAETASTFCQKIVENAALKEADRLDQIIIIDGLLEYAARVVLNAMSDFRFEEALFEKRRQRKLSVAEFCQLSLEAQREAFGDGLDPDGFHPYRWAYVPHYYMTNYYNFPYTFGLLFGLGLYAVYQEEPESFKLGYDELLASTGMGEAADLAARFGIDIRSKAFWVGSLDVLRADIDRFEALLEEEKALA